MGRGGARGGRRARPDHPEAAMRVPARYDDRGMPRRFPLSSPDRRAASYARVPPPCPSSATYGGKRG